jgi:hypothetical protein
VPRTATALRWETLSRATLRTTLPGLPTRPSAGDRLGPPTEGADAIPPNRRAGFFVKHEPVCSLCRITTNCLAAVTGKVYLVRSSAQYERVLTTQCGTNPTSQRSLRAVAAPPSVIHYPACIAHVPNQSPCSDSLRGLVQCVVSGVRRRSPLHRSSPIIHFRCIGSAPTRHRLPTNKADSSSHRLINCYGF